MSKICTSIALTKSSNVFKTFLVLASQLLLRLLVFLTLSFGFQVSANENFKFRMTIDLNEFHLNDRLAHLSIETIYRDSKGHMWFGTQDGLSRYNGLSIENFLTNDGKSRLSDNYIVEIMESKSGDILVTHREGVDKFDSQKAAFEPLLSLNRIEDIDIRKSGIDGDGNIWILTRNHGIIKYSGDTATKINRYLEDTSMLTMTVANDEVWAAGENTLYFYNKKIDIFQPVNLRGSDSVSGVRTINLIGEQLVLGGKNKAILYSRSEKPYSEIEATEILNCAGTVNGVFKRRDFYWVTTSSHICIFESGSKELQKIIEKPTPFLIQSGLTDNSNVIWFGTNSGVKQYWGDLSLFNHFKLTDGNIELGGVVTAFAESEHWGLIIGTWNNGIFSQKNMPMENLKNKHVVELHIDALNNLWVGTYASGILRFNRNGLLDLVINKSNNNVLQSDSVSAIKSLDYSSILFTTFGGGLYQYQVESGVLLQIAATGHSSQTISSNYITSFAPMNNGGLLLGLYDGSAESVSLKTDKDYFSDKVNFSRLGIERVMGITKLGRMDTYAISTQDNGVYIVELDASRRQIEKKLFNVRTSPLVSDSVYGSLRGGKDNLLWLSHSKGLSAINLRQGKVVNFKKQDGLQGADFNSGSYFKSTIDEKLYFGGGNGFNQVNIDNYLGEVEASTAKIHVDSVTDIVSQLNLKPTKLSGNNHYLVENGAAIEIRFYIDDYAYPRNQEYYYNWMSDDEMPNNWRKMANGTLSISPLKEGIHRIRIKGRDGYGKNIENELTIVLEVPPVFWKSSLAYFGYSLVFVLLLLIIEYLRKRKETELLVNQKKLELEVKKKTSSLSDAIKSLQAIKDELERESRTDYLTGLYNRRYFKFLTSEKARLFNTLEQREGDTSLASLGLILIDIDYFKKINDELGHDTGDQVLEVVGKVLRAVSSSDVHGFRWGGEEFLVLVEKASQTQLTDLIYKINGLLKIEFSKISKNGNNSITCSFGVGHGTVPVDCEMVPCLNSLFNLADVALYRAKHHGRNSFSYLCRDALLQSGISNFEKISLENAISRGQVEAKVTPFNA